MFKQPKGSPRFPTRCEVKIKSTEPFTGKELNVNTQDIYLIKKLKPGKVGYVYLLCNSKTGDLLRCWVGEELLIPHDPKADISFDTMMKRLKRLHNGGINNG